MKKYFAVLAMMVVLAPVQAKACWFTDLFTVAADYVCAGAEGKATAADMLAAIELGKGLIADKEITAVDISNAISILMVIRDTGCFVRDQLKAAFEVVDAGNAALNQKQNKMLKGSGGATVPEYAPLRVYVQ